MAKKATKKEDTATKKPTTKKTVKKVEKVELDKKRMYAIEATNSSYLAKGKIYNVTGEIAEILINSGQAKMK